MKENLIECETSQSDIPGDRSKNLGRQNFVRHTFLKVANVPCRAVRVRTLVSYASLAFPPFALHLCIRDCLFIQRALATEALPRDSTREAMGVLTHDRYQAYLIVNHSVAYSYLQKTGHYSANIVSGNAKHASPGKKCTNLHSYVYIV